MWIAFATNRVRDRQLTRYADAKKGRGSQGRTILRSMVAMEAQWHKHLKQEQAE